ncbi:hypothetical protein OKW40_005722 [Paraburkholderia sp. RAU6.4a]|uniref:hypothetical protein n=1 Tax=Paraburkholderia sp. RAU6.4a TaxID=2991067 RepID=UPI003D203ED0
MSALVMGRANEPTACSIDTSTVRPSLAVAVRGGLAQIVLEGRAPARCILLGADGGIANMRVDMRRPAREQR